jgi:hypothetical protein
MKKTIRLTESDLIRIVKKIISEQDDVPVGKCDLTKLKGGGISSEECKRAEKDLAKAQKTAAIDDAAETKAMLDMAYDRNNEPLSKEERKQVYNDYKEFIATNKEQLMGGSYKPEQNYAVALKTLWYANNYPDSTYTTSLIKKFNNPNIENSTINDIIRYARQIGWDNFIKWYKAGGPEL